MCTAMTLQTQQGEIFLGRTMDFSYPLDPSVYAVPRNYEWTNGMKTGKIRNRYAYIGVGQEIPALTIADGVNERGLAVAALYFRDLRHLINLVGPGGLPRSRPWKWRGFCWEYVRRWMKRRRCWGPSRL